MKVIDLLNKMANGEKLPKKILIRDKVYYLINDADGDMVYSQATNKSNWEAFIDHRLNITRCLNEDVLILDTGVEISEEDTIDIDNIEEFNEDKARKEIFTYTGEEGKKSNLYCFSLFTERHIIPKINEVIRKVNKLEKEIKSIKEK